MKRTLIVLLSIMIIASIYAKGSMDAIDDYLNNVTVGNPIEYRNLRIFPLIAKTVLSHEDYMTMDEAMDRGWLKIKESGEGNVNFVEVKNNGKEMVFLLTGEMITGAKQDRMVQEDILLPANSGWVRVPVYCVEHGRWSGSGISQEFKSSKLVVPNAVRQRAENTKSQSEVWDGVAESQENLDVASPTGNVKDTYENKKVQKEITDYSKHMSHVPELSRSTIGVVVTTGNRIICFDLFANNHLMRKFWDKLIKSYAMDALSGSRSSLDKEDIYEFLEIVESAHYISSGTPGSGNLFTIESHMGKGSALVYEDAVVHMDFFPREGIIKSNDSNLDLDFRRQRR